MTGLSEKEFYNKYPDQQSFMMEYGGMVEQYKKGGWIQKATASIKRRGTEGKCTPMSKPGCTGRALALAKTFHKMAAKRKKKEEGGYVDMYEDGGKLPEGILRARLESHMSPDETQDYINNYAQGGVVDVYQLMGMPTPSMYGMGGPLKEKSMLANPVESMYDKKGNLIGIQDTEQGTSDYGTMEDLDVNNLDNINARLQKEIYARRSSYLRNSAGPTNYQFIENEGLDSQFLNRLNTQSIYPNGGRIMNNKNFPNMGYAMGGQVNYPQGLRKNMGNMPIFAMGGMTGAPTEINVEKGELLVDPETGKILTEYKGGGMVPHPEYGMDERGTVPAQEGKFVIPVKYKMGGIPYAERYKKAWKENDKDLMNALKNNTAYRKAKLEAKEEAEASKMMAKYGGAIQRMMARGGMINKYDLGGGTGGLNMNNPGLGSYNLPSSFSQDYSTPVAGPLWNAYGSPSQFNMNNLFQGTSQQTPTPGGLPLPTPLGKADNLGFNYNMNNYLNTMRQQGIRNNQDVTIPTYARQGVDADGNPVSINPNMPSGYIPPGYEAKGGADMSNMNKYLPYAMQAAPVLYNLAQGLKKPTKIPGTLGNMPTDLQAPKLLGDAGRRALARESALGRYAWRQAGAQAGPAALTAMTNARMARSADYEEKLRNAQGQMDYQAAAQRKAYEQFNAQQAMNRYMLQAQADAVPTQYTSAGMGQLGQMGESMLNRQMLKELYG